VVQGQPGINTNAQEELHLCLCQPVLPGQIETVVGFGKSCKKTRTTQRLNCFYQQSGTDCDRRRRAGRIPRRQQIRTIISLCAHDCFASF
jgi:hypothetical protein